MKRRNKIKIVGFIEKIEHKKFLTSLLLRTLSGHLFKLKVTQKNKATGEINNMITKKQKILFNGRRIIPIPGPMRRGIIA